MFDQTSFSKYAVTGADALRTLQWVCANDVDVAVGQAVYTPWLNVRGRWIVRAYRSRVDGSVQPYAVLLPTDFDSLRPSMVR